MQSRLCNVGYAIPQATQATQQSINERRVCKVCCPESINEHRVCKVCCPESGNAMRAHINEHRVCKFVCLQAGDVSDVLAIYARMNIRCVNLCVYRHGMCVCVCVCA